MSQRPILWLGSFLFVVDFRVQERVIRTSDLLGLASLGEPESHLFAADWSVALKDVPWRTYLGNRGDNASILPFDSLDLLGFVVDDAPDFDLIQTIHDAFLRSGT